MAIDTQTLLDAFILFTTLPWLHIIIGVIIAHLLGWLWYGTLFNKPYMHVTGSTETESNWGAVGMNFLGILALGYLIGVMTLLPDTGALLALDALLAVIFVMNLANAMFRFGNTKNAVTFWLITAGYEMLAVCIIAVTVFFF